MSRYEVWWASGTTRQRQMDGNRENLIAYVEHHFNALAQDKLDTQADNPALAIVGSNASVASFAWAKRYSEMVAKEFGIRDAGVLRGPRRGNWNVYYCKCPSILVEPLFCSDPAQAAIIKSEDGQNRLARILVQSITEQFPDGGRVGFSVGHLGRPRPMANDKGAPLHGGGWEADYAKIVMEKAAKLLEAT